MWSMSKRTVQRRTRKKCRCFERFVTDGSEKADELAKAGEMWDEGFMAQVRPKTSRQEREKKCTQPCRMQPVSTLLWRNWKDCEELKPKSNEKCVFQGVVCCYQLVSMHEM